MLNSSFKKCKLKQWYISSKIADKIFNFWPIMGFPGGSDGKCLLAMWEPWVRYLGWEDYLEKEMAPHSSTLAWKIP